MIRIYRATNDWAGLGYNHYMVCWNWRGTPRSITWGKRT